MAHLIEIYNYVINDLSDRRTKNWIGFSSPIMILTIIAIYLFNIYILLPWYMNSRKPYNLKTTIKYYNIFQIIYCTSLVYGFSSSGWFTTYSWGCQEVDYSNNPEAIRMLNVCYYGLVLKAIDLIETVFFILRKKYQQVSILHVYHHCMVLFLGWIGVKYVAGGMATFTGLINTFVHILMYTYYLLASLGPEYQKKLKKWKPRLTMCQMVQFCIIMAHALQSLHPDCRVPKQLLIIYIPNVLIVFYMFWDFYKKNYIKKQE